MSTSKDRVSAHKDVLGDDLVLPFATRLNGVSGRLVRLGPLVDEVLSRHAYPEVISVALGEALVLTALLGSALKFEGQLILQTNAFSIV